MSRARAHRRWWLYVALVCALGYGRTIERLVRESGGFWSQFGPPLGATVVAIGIAGWLRGRGLGHAWLWRLVHACACLALGAGLILGGYLALEPLFVPASLVLGSALALVPACRALGDYAYRSRDLWTVEG